MSETVQSIEKIGGGEVETLSYTINTSYFSNSSTVSVKKVGNILFLSFVLIIKSNVTIPQNADLLTISLNGTFTNFIYFHADIFSENSSANAPVCLGLGLSNKTLIYYSNMTDTAITSNNRYTGIYGSTAIAIC